MPIRTLPPLLVNQIAAGEVIERPASVVKELVENAVDADATRISVEIEQGGKELVRVSDDGRGVPEDELMLALAPHATSKIAAAGDLDMIATMGFRGEALASIASVSRISFRSRPAGSPGAAVVEGEGDRLEGPRPAAGPPGTTVIVRNLFFNTPARRKFLRTDQTETGRIVEVLESIALAHPAIGFTLVADGRTRLDLPPAQTPRHRVLAVLGAELEPELLEVTGHEAAPGRVGVWGLAGTPGLARATSRHQRTFINGRPIVDRALHHAIKEAYRGLIEPTRSPTIALFLRIDPAEVDVNVHPAKAEVRFRHQRAVHGVVLAAVRAALRAADLTPAFDVAPETSSVLPPFPAARADGTAAGRPRAAAVIDYFRGLDTRQKGFVYSEMKEALAREAPELLEEAVAGGGPDARSAPVVPAVRTVQDALQVHRSYIVTQDEDGMLIIDQHALHERVMFEKLRERIDVGALEAQRLLMPAVLDADPARLEALATLGPILARLGIEAEPMGPGAIGVHAFTSLLFARKVDPVEFMSELLDRAAGGDRREGLPADPEAALHEVLDMMACKAAIKAGDRLEPREIEELLECRATVERSSNCPHGRPTTLRLSLRELEKRFGRR